MSLGSIKESLSGSSSSDASVGAVVDDAGCIDCSATSSGGTGDGDGLCASLWLINTGSSSDIFAITEICDAAMEKNQRRLLDMLVARFNGVVDQP